MCISPHANFFSLFLLPINSPSMHYILCMLKIISSNDNACKHSKTHNIWLMHFSYNWLNISEPQTMNIILASHSTLIFMSMKLLSTFKQPVSGSLPGWPQINQSLFPCLHSDMTPWKSWGPPSRSLISAHSPHPLEPHPTSDYSITIQIRWQLLLTVIQLMVMT